MSDCCKDCGKVLSSDEIGLYKRLVNRGAESFLCLSCMSGYFGCDEEILVRKIKHFRSIGCTLFSNV